MVFPRACAPPLRGATCARVHEHPKVEPHDVQKRRSKQGTPTRPAAEPLKYTARTHGKPERAQGKFEEAVADYTAAIELSPQHCRAHYNRAYALDKLGRYAEAVADYDAAIAFDASNATAFHNRGSLLERLGDAERALADFSRAIELDPAAALPYNARGLLLEARGAREEALADYGGAVERDGAQPLFRRNRGVCLRACGRYEEAARDLQRCGAFRSAGTLFLRACRGLRFDNVCRQRSALLPHDGTSVCRMHRT